jgi:hypothetical protein
MVIMVENPPASEILITSALTERARNVPVFEQNKLGKFLGQTEITSADIAGKDIDAAYQYWNHVRREQFAPARRDIKLDELPPKLIPSVAIVDFVDDPIDYLYRFFGTNLVQVSGMELTGKRYFADKVKGYGFVNEKLFPEMIIRREPLFHIVKWQSIRDVSYETTSVRLPLSDDGKTVTGCMTANAWASLLNPDRTRP